MVANSVFLQETIDPLNYAHTHMSFFINIFKKRPISVLLTSLERNTDTQATQVQTIGVKQINIFIKDNSSFKD